MLHEIDLNMIPAFLVLMMKLALLTCLCTNKQEGTSSVRSKHALLLFFTNFVPQRSDISKNTWFVDSDSNILLGECSTLLSVFYRMVPPTPDFILVEHLRYWVRPNYDYSKMTTAIVTTQNWLWQYWLLSIMTTVNNDYLLYV
jgi:hypothetical protein